MTTAEERETPHPDGGYKDADLIWCIEVFLALDAKGTILVRGSDKYARDLLKVCRQRLLAHHHDRNELDVMAELNELMLNRPGGDSSNTDTRMQCEAWANGFEEAWTIASRFVSALNHQPNKGRDGGLEEAARWHERRADRHRRRSGGLSNALRHEHYAAELRLLKGSSVLDCQGEAHGDPLPIPESSRDGAVRSTN